VIGVYHSSAPIWDSGQSRTRVVCFEQYVPQKVDCLSRRAARRPKVESRVPRLFHSHHNIRTSCCLPFSHSSRLKPYFLRSAPRTLILWSPSGTVWVVQLEWSVPFAVASGSLHRRQGTRPGPRAGRWRKTESRWYCEAYHEDRWVSKHEQSTIDKPSVGGMMRDGRATGFPRDAR
jgi:hypothetical protein